MAQILERYFGFVDGCWRFAGLEPPESAREACEVSLDPLAARGGTMRALPAPPRSARSSRRSRALQADAPRLRGGAARGRAGLGRGRDR